MSLRPKVVKLLDKYNRKQGGSLSRLSVACAGSDGGLRAAELRAIQDKFDHAKATYESIVAESTEITRAREAREAAERQAAQARLNPPERESFFVPLPPFRLVLIARW